MLFEMSGGLDIGARNEAAVRGALANARVMINAAKTGGTTGRTLKVAVADLTVTVRSAGQRPETLLEGRAPRATTTAGAAR